MIFPRIQIFKAGLTGGLVGLLGLARYRPQKLRCAARFWPVPANEPAIATLVLP